MSPTAPLSDQVHSVLLASKLFGALAPAHLDLLVGQLRVEAVEAGSHVFREGEASDSLVIVLTGRLRVTRVDARGNLLLYNELCPGESQGEAGLMLGQPRPANLIALRDSHIARLDRQGFEALLDQFFGPHAYHDARHEWREAAGYALVGVLMLFGSYGFALLIDRRPRRLIAMLEMDR